MAIPGLLAPKKFAQVFGFPPSSEEQERVAAYFRNVAFRIDLHREQAIFYTNSTLCTLVELIYLVKGVEGYDKDRAALQERLRSSAGRMLAHHFRMMRCRREFNRSCRLANRFGFEIDDDYYEHLIHEGE